MAAPPTWLVELVVPVAAVPVFQSLLDEHAEAVTIFEARPDGSIWRISGYSETEPDRTAIEGAARDAARAAGQGLPAIRIERLGDRNWLAENRRSFAPIDAGRFHVHPTHVPPPGDPDRIEIELDAGPAFGSGSHETTQGCLILLDRLSRRRGFGPQCLLDLGCGSGILAIAMAWLWGRPVEAVDHDPVAVETAADNARRNGVAELVRTREADALDRGVFGGERRFELIAANILAGPLIDIARPLSAALAPGGLVLLSGILSRQEKEVRAAYREAGLKSSTSVRLGEWPTLLLRRPLTPN